MTQTVVNNDEPILAVLELGALLISNIEEVLYKSM